jgi:hypothetical protein
MQFGKHKGLDITEVPQDYIEWFVKDQQDKIKVFTDELNRRKYVLDNSWMKQIIDNGYADLCKTTLPPDRPRLDAAYQALLKAVTAAGSPQTSP